MTGCHDLFGRFHLQGVIEAIEVIEEADSRQQFNNLAFIKILLQFGPELVINVVGILGHALGQTQRSLLLAREITAILKIVQVVDLVVCPSEPPCQDGVGGQSIFALVDLRGPGND